MNKNRIALGTYEIELLTKMERDIIFSEMRHSVGYINTAISYNNDHIINAISNQTNYKIISKIFPKAYHYSYHMMVSKHLEYLHRDRIDIMLIHNARSEWHNLAQRLENDGRFIEVGVSNFDVPLLEEYKNFIGHYPAYNEIEINPHYCDVETVNFCKKNEIKIIAYTILGGKYKAERMVADYGLPEILKYVLSKADIVIIRPDSINEAKDYMEVLSNLEGTESSSIPDAGIKTKSMVPLDYPLPDIQKTYEGMPTYSNTACKKGYHIKSKRKSEYLTNFAPKDFEFISEYKVWLKYYITDALLTEDDYVHDFIRCENKYYGIYLYDNNKLTKVNKGIVEVKVYDSYDHEDVEEAAEFARDIDFY